MRVSQLRVQLYYNARTCRAAQCQRRLTGSASRERAVIVHKASKREKHSACKFAQSEPLVYSGTPLLTEVHCNTVGIGDSKVDVVFSSSGTTRASEDKEVVRPFE